MAIDMDTNLLSDFLPPVGVGEGLARDFDLLEILLYQFKKAQGDEEGQEVIFLDSDNPALRVVFNPDHQLVALYAMPGLSETALTAIRERVRVDLVDTPGVGIGREICFSDAPVQGWWRHHDCIQILPVPPHAPHPTFGLAQFPFLLEFPYNRSNSSPGLDIIRRLRAIRPIHLVLNALLTRPIWSKRASTETFPYEWVFLPSTANPPELSAAYFQRGYSYEGYTPVPEAFSPVDDIPPIATIPATEYYGDGYWAYWRPNAPLVIPDNLGQSFDLFFHHPKRQGKFLRACYWLSQADQVTSSSLSFICAVQAVDALLPRAPSGIRCEQCGLERGKSRTVLFAEFLSRFAPSPMVTDADRKALFRVRSQLSHGFQDPFMKDLAIGFALHPQASTERRDRDLALRTARVALYNWLHTPEPVT